MICVLIHRHWNQAQRRLCRQAAAPWLGLELPKPLLRAYQQNAEMAEQWKQTVLVTKKGKQVGATIYFQDESGIRSDFHSGTTWAPRGLTPVIEATGARFSLNMVGAIDMRGAAIHGGQGQRVVGADLRFSHPADAWCSNPVFLIWDGHPTHRSRIVRECIDSFKASWKNTKPSYSPHPILFERLETLPNC